jgi:hypothetical protein
LGMAQQGISTARPSMSKQILKTEFERIKPLMLKKLEDARAASAPVIF